jgi:hypothetical protein
MTTYQVYASIPILIDLKLDGVALTLSGYTSGAAYNDSTKGAVTLTIQDTTGATVSDAQPSPLSLDHITMFANGTNYSQAHYTIAYGLATAGDYIATVWYSKTSGGVITTRAVTRITIGVVNETPVATYPS